MSAAFQERGPRVAAPLPEEVTDLRDVWLGLGVQLVEAVSAACPGFHVPRQHRDGRPAWCPDCGRDRFGVQFRDLDPAP